MDNLLSSSINTIEIWSSSVSPSSMRNKEHHFFHSISRVQEVVVNLDLSNKSLMLFCSPFHLKRGLHPQPRVMSLIQPARQSPKKTREYITTHRKIFKRKMTEKLQCWMTVTQVEKLPILKKGNLGYFRRTCHWIFTNLIKLAALVISFSSAFNKRQVKTNDRTSVEKRYNRDNKAWSTNLNIEGSSISVTFWIPAPSPSPCQFFYIGKAQRSS